MTFHFEIVFYENALTSARVFFITSILSIAENIQVRAVFDWNE